MAIETLILRPVSITCDNESLVTLYPADTTISEAHILVNEEAMDDDATYITGGLGSNIHFHFNLTKPYGNEYNITNFSFKVRHKFDTSSSGHTVTYQMNIESDNYTLNTLSENPTVYTDMSDRITDDTRSTIINKLNSSQNLDFYITQTVTGGNKAKPIRVT